MDKKSAFGSIVISTAVFLQTRPGMFVAGCLAGAVFMYGGLRVDNARVLRDLERREAVVAQQVDGVRDMQGMSQAELQSWVHELHEQNRVTRTVQDRLHKQEVSLARTPVYLVGVTLALVLLLAWIIYRIHREMSDVAVSTITNAVGLAPSNMIKTFVVAQSQVNAVMTTTQVHDATNKLNSKCPNRKRLR